MYKEEIFSETSVHKFLVNMSSWTLILIIVMITDGALFVAYHSSCDIVT